MKYIYSEKYQEAAIIEHKGLTSIQAAQRLMVYLKGNKKPCLSITMKDKDGLAAYNFNDTINYGKHGDLAFCGFGAACLGADNHYKSTVNRYKVRAIN